MSNYNKMEEFTITDVKELTKENLIHNINKAIGFIPVLEDEGCSVLIIASFDIAKKIIDMGEKQLLCTATAETFYKPHSLCKDRIKVTRSFNYVKIDKYYISLLSDNNLEPQNTMVVMYNGI